MEPVEAKKKNFLECSVEQRQKLAENQLKLRPDYVPIYMEPNRLLEGEKEKAPGKRYNLHRQQKVLEIPQKVQAIGKLSEQHKSIFFFTKYPKPMFVLPNESLGDIYDKKKSQDSWLYMLYDNQNTLGGSE